MASIGDLKPDSRNARRHTPRNVGVIEHSIQTNGFGRSVLLAADGTVIAGNATIDAAASAGLEDVLIVESDGSKVIAVKRTDVAPGSPEFHALAVADNRAAELAEWEPAVLEELSGEIDLSAFFFDEELARVLEQAADDILAEIPDDRYQEQYGVIVICEDAAEQERIYGALNAEGYTCRVVVT